MFQVILLLLWSGFIVWIVYTTPQENEKNFSYKEKVPFAVRVKWLDIGFRLLQKTPIQHYQPLFLPFIRKANIVYADGSGEWINELVLAKQMTQFLMGLPMVILLSFVSLEIGLLSSLALGLLIFNERYRIEQQYTRKQQRMREQLSNVLFQFVLLISAGQTIMDAFEKVAYAKEGELYEEMRYCVQQVAYGMSQIEALSNMASRCDDSDIKRMVNLLMQTQQKGSSELSRLFFDMSQVNWARKKTRLLKNAKNAATQLLLPSGIIFLGIIIMMILPLWANGFLN